MLGKFSCKQLILFAGLIVGSQSVYALDCQLGSDLSENMENVLSIHEGAENLDDINAGLGLIPSQIIPKKIREIRGDVGKVNDYLSDMVQVCSVMTNKDPIEQYFSAMDFLFDKSKLPMAGWVKQNVKMARQIVNDANRIATGIVDNQLASNAYVGVNFNMSITHDKFGLDHTLTSKELIEKNLVKSVSVICKSQNGAMSYAPLGLNHPNNVAKTPYSNIGLGMDILNATGCNPPIDKMFLNVVWKSNQRSVIPLSTNYVNASNSTVTVPFITKDFSSFTLNK